MKKQDGVDKLAMMLSFMAALMSVLVSVFGFDLWFAGTQWMLIAIVLGVWAIYNKNCGCVN